MSAGASRYDDAEEVRLRAFDALRLDCVAEDADFEALTKLAADVLDVPLAVVTLVGRDTQRALSSSEGGSFVVPRSQSFCAHSLRSAEVMLVPDARADPRFRDNALVLGPPHIVAYAGAPLRARDGTRLGSFCLCDRRPRTFSEAEIRRLRQFAHQAEALIEARLVRRRAELEHRLLELEHVLAPQGILVTDEASRPVRWNRRVLEIWNLHPGDLSAGKRRDWVRSFLGQVVDPRAVQRSVLAHLRAGGGRTPFDFRLRDGRVVEAFAARIKAPEAGWIWYYTDVTEDRRNAEELARARAEAESASRAKSRFLAAMSHEIRTPLTTVIGLAEMLSAGRLDPVQFEQLRILRNSAEGLLAIVNDVLDLSRIEADAFVAREVEFDVRTLVRDCLEVVAPRVDRSQVCLYESVDEDVPRRVRGDGARLRQILVNLAGNAAKFTGRGSIELRVSRARDEAGERLRFAVRDTGVGIAPADQAQLFQPFRQVGRAVDGKDGSGLGLSICQRIVARLGGTILVESAPGAGSTFTVELPLPAAAESGEPVPVEPSVAPLVPAPRVLLVEDHPVNRKVAEALLGRLGCSIRSAGDGEEALAILAKESFDVVLMDVNMPRLDGLEATRRLRERAGPAAPRVVALTAGALEDEREACRRAGMDDFLGKPFRLADLRAVLARCPASSRAAAPFAPEGGLEALAPVESVRADLEAHLRGLGLAGQPAFIASLGRIFLDETGPGLDELVGALEAGDLVLVHKRAHALKGAAASLGARDLARVAAVLEKAARAGTAVDSEAWSRVLRAAHDRVREVLGSAWSP